MRTESFMSKLRNKAGAAKAAIGRVFDRKQATKPQAAPAPAAMPAQPVQPVDEAEAKAKGEGLTPKTFKLKGPAYTPPRPSPATLIQRRQRKARRITRRAA